MAANKVSLGLVYRFCSPLSFSLIPDVGKLALAVPKGVEPSLIPIDSRMHQPLCAETKLPQVGFT